jgi:hypothetical protein
MPKRLSHLIFSWHCPLKGLFYLNFDRPAGQRRCWNLVTCCSRSLNARILCRINSRRLYHTHLHASSTHRAQVGTQAHSNARNAGTYTYRLACTYVLVKKYRIPYSVADPVLIDPIFPDLGSRIPIPNPHFCAISNNFFGEKILEFFC